MDKNPAAAKKRTVPAGTHMGLEMRIKGVKKMRPMTVAVMVRPVRKSKMQPETMRAKKPMN